MTRRLKSKAMREAATTARAFVASDTGKKLREMARQFSDSDVCKNLRQSVAGLDLARLRADALAAHAAAAKQALASLTADDDESDAPAPRPRRKGGRAPLYDWIGAKQHLADHIKANGGLPEARKELIGIAQVWFGDRAPNERDIRRQLVDPFYPPKQKVGKPAPKVGELPR